ncbi:DUF4399 domain-containing protein [Flocculibacter collagenilyticus]|uniref:DUF4399 domain-containing protein n=1 Tax=Flocculibacter collagenilyticus TaxID=2744479 RepID=UPI0018F39111|nr:DUF4399 domain-containing protein [Flocculibacter collagenilyticus]
MLKQLSALALVAAATLSSTAVMAHSEHNHIKKSPAPAEAKVYFITPQDGDTVSETFTVKFGLSGMGVAPAGADIKHTGHHHLIIDGELPSFDAPMGGNVKHFGGGQTETSVTLPKGKHTLQLIMGDKHHIPHDRPVYSKKITITVK